MVETTSHLNIYDKSNNAMHFKLSEIYRIKNYFVDEIHKKETISKTLSKYIAAFGCVNNTLLVLSLASSSTCIVLFATANGNLCLVFSIGSGIVKTLLKTMNKKKKKHNKIAFLARNKLNSIGKLISKTLIDNEICHEDFTTIMNEAENCRKQKQE